MASLTGQKIKDTYQSLLKTDDNGLVTGVFKNITDGSGSASGLYLKNDGVFISGSLTVSGSLNATSLTASLQGTASWSNNATTSSYAAEALSSSFAITASHALNANSSIPTLQQVVDAGSTIVDGDYEAALGATYFYIEDTNTGNGSYADDTGVGAYDNDGNQFSLRPTLISRAKSNNVSQLEFEEPTVNSTVIVPNKSGTLALTSDITGSLNVDTGSFATTGSNTFKGSQVISSSLIVVSQSLVDPIVSFIGSSGSLMNVYDSNSGSIFSVNNDLGLPILNVKSDQTVFIGEYSSPALYTSARKSINSGSNTNVYSFPTSSYDSFFVDYSTKSGSLAKVGKLMAIWNGATVSYSEFATHSIGVVSDFYIGFELSGSSIALLSSASSDSWTLNTIIKAI